MTDVNVTQLVDFWNRPYPEDERLAHNARVDAGAPYAHLYTLDEMSQRYRLLAKPRKVFDLHTGRTWSPGEFHGIYTACNVRVGKKRAYVSQLCLQQLAVSPEMGVFFHGVENGEITFQGQILTEPERGVYTVQLYEWIIGAESNSGPVPAAQMKGWLWYGSADEMRAAYELMESQSTGVVVLAC